MKNKLWLAFAFLMLLGTSCVTQRKCNAKFPPVTSRDSVYIEKLKEVPVYLPGDTVNIEVPVNCPDQNIATIENGKLIQQIRILNGKLISNTQFKPDTVKVFVKDTKTVVNEVKVPQPVKYVPKIVKIFAWVGGILLVLIIGYVAVRIFKPKIL